MRKYEAPEMEVIELNVENVFTALAGGSLEGLESPGDGTDVGDVKDIFGW